MSTTDSVNHTIHGGDNAGTGTCTCHGRRSSRRTIALVAGALGLILLTSTSTAVASQLLTGADIQDGSITGVDIQRQSIGAGKLKLGSIKVEHLDRTSIRAGHVHSSHEPNVIGDGPSIASTTAPVVYLYNNVFTVVAKVSALPAGTYVVQSAGSMWVQPTAGGGTIWPNLAICNLVVGTTTVATEKLGPRGGDFWTYATISHVRVVTLNAPSDVTVQCEMSTGLTPSPTWSIGQATVDLVALPVTSYTAG